MSGQKESPNSYGPCKDIKRTTPDTAIDEDLVKEITFNYRTLPSFEKTVFERKFIKHYSLSTNELLKCRWAQYKKNIEQRVYAPFEFPENRDIHFHNGSVRFLPSRSIYRYPEHRFKLKPGPGVDYYGQMPIPQELLMKREKVEKEGTVRKIVEKDTKKKENKLVEKELRMT